MMSQGERIDALERAFIQLAEQTAMTAAIAVAQGVICRAVAEMLARGASTPLSEVRELAMAMAAGMGGGIAENVRTILAEEHAPSLVQH
jgi:hypothetical protein